MEKRTYKRVSFKGRLYALDRDEALMSFDTKRFEEHIRKWEGTGAYADGFLEEYVSMNEDTKMAFMCVAMCSLNGFDVKSKNKAMRWLRKHNAEYLLEYGKK